MGIFKSRGYYYEKQCFIMRQSVEKEKARNWFNCNNCELFKNILRLASKLGQSDV